MVSLKIFERESQKYRASIPKEGLLRFTKRITSQKYNAYHTRKEKTEMTDEPTKMLHEPIPVDMVPEVVIDEDTGALRVNPAWIAAAMREVAMVAYRMPNTTTVVTSAFFRGFCLATEYAACVDPKLFKLEVGEQIAGKKALAAAEQKLWELQGWLLHRQMNEPRL